MTAVDEQTRAGRGTTGGIQVIARAAEVLRLLQAAPSGLTQAEVVERIGLAKSTVHRILGALEAEGLVTLAGNRGRYRLGPEVRRMAASVRSALVVDLRPYLEELARELRETVDLSVLENHQVVFVDQVVSDQRLRAVSAVGAGFPPHCCAPGKAMLAALPVTALEDAVPNRLTAETPHTLTTRSALRRDLDGVRRTGVALDREEHTLGICAVGVAVRTAAWGVAAISVPTPTQRFAGREPAIADALLRARDLIERDFGPVEPAP
ncbi:IclR family transcriptional regulator [Streptomyces sp. CB03238]|uniref:IclR family transcriptional regulator n=1 Tax=Streptomyces sp. CB03238 TaxID=1907777 RepID=UPI000A0F6D0F|nr:IclR family transcriptional regulator [Streptomyces sp. CB03238]ORT57056.1 transcriptional regulator [Streptomyces sp. CB03238]